MSSNTAPKEAELKKAETPVQNFRTKLRRFFPIILFGVFLLAAWIVRSFAMESVSALANTFVLCLAAVATLLVLNQRLPLQNVIALAFALALFSGTILLTASALKVAVVPPVANGKFRYLPIWAAPLLWTVALINARGIAKFVLHGLRKKNNYGVALILLSSLLVASLNLCAESSWKNFFVQFTLASTALVVTTPWFIDKKPVEHSPDFQPLLISVLLMLW